MSRALFALLLVMPVLAGCLGGSDDALDPGAAGGAGEVPTLPDGLEMEGAEVIAYNDTTAELTWSGTINLGQEPALPSNPALAEAWTALRVPLGVDLRLKLVLDWSTGHDLDLHVLNETGEPVCYASGLDHPETCTVPWVQADDAERSWTVRVEFSESAHVGPAAQHEVPFEIRTTVQARAPPGSSPFPVIHDTHGRLLDRSAFPGGLPAYTQRHVTDRSSWEPTLGIGPDGVAFFVSADTADVAMLDPSNSEILRSRDGGVTWETVTPRAIDQPYPVYTADPYLEVDPVTGRVFSLDAQGGCHWLVFTDDQGASWTTNPVACGRPGANHYQSLVVGSASGVETVGYPNAVYVCQKAYAGTTSCARSLDGGLSFGPAMSVAPYPSPECVERGRADVDNQDGGHAFASMAADGTVYVPALRCGVVTLDVSHDHGLTWKHVVVDETVPARRDDSIQPAMATDADGNVYMVWIDHDRMPHLSVSTNQGRSWSVPQPVAAPGIEAARYPNLAAGDAGRIALSYMGHTGDRAWHLFVATSLDALADDVVFVTDRATAADDPLRRGLCNSLCGNTREFLDLDMDPATGGVWASLVDHCHPDCAEAGAGMDGRESAKGAVAVQTGGVALLMDPPEAWGTGS